MQDAILCKRLENGHPSPFCIEWVFFKESQDTPASTGMTFGVSSQRCTGDLFWRWLNTIYTGDCHTSFYFTRGATVLTGFQFTISGGTSFQPTMLQAFSQTIAALGIARTISGTTCTVKLLHLLNALHKPVPVPCTPIPVP